jgi:hypothetical protein
MRKRGGFTTYFKKITSRYTLGSGFHKVAQRPEKVKRCSLRVINLADEASRWPTHRPEKSKEKKGG